MRRIIALFLAAGFSIACLSSPALAEEPPTNQPPPVDTQAMGAIAVVGPGRVMADQVFEIWTPVWYETLAKVRNGKLDPAAGDAKLDAEWRHAVMALIKDEVFYQEAEREHNSMINTVVDNIMRQGGGGKPRGDVAAEIRRLVDQDMNRQFQRLSADLVKESGGMVKLHKVLEGRGISVTEWQTRLKKKAFTQSYLSMILKPRTPDPGPKQIQEYYASHTDEFSQPGLVRFKHIYFSNAKRGAEAAREAAIEAWEKMADGEIDFAAAVAKYSDDEPSKRRGGEESGEEAADPEREAWLSDIRKALREEKPGETAPIMESSFGCHIAQLIDIGPDRKTPFNEVRRDIERKLQNDAWEAATDLHFAEVRKTTEIRVLVKSFPSHLSCAAQAGLDSRSAAVYQIGGAANPDIKVKRRGGK